MSLLAILHIAENLFYLDVVIDKGSETACLLFGRCFLGFSIFILFGGAAILGRFAACFAIFFILISVR